MWVDRWTESGKTCSDFAQTHDLAVSSLYQWKKRLKNDCTPPAKPNFTKVVVRRPDGPASGDPDAEVVFESGVRVRVYRDMPHQQLSLLLQAARAC